MPHRLSPIRWTSFGAALILATVAAAGALATASKPSRTIVDHRSLPTRRLKTPGDRFEGDFLARLRNGPSSRRFVALTKARLTA